MKKLAAFALLATAAAAACAQSSVTLFGVVDVAARHVKNADTSVSTLNSGGMNSSRVGLRGVEDLGGGLTASFWLEHGFNADTGALTDSARFWNRRSTASLTGGYGEVRLGRDFTPTYTAWADFDVFGTNGVADANKFASVLGTNADTKTRADNEVTYFLPGNLGGIYGQVTVAAGEAVTGKKYVGGRVGYAAGPLNVSFAYGKTDVTQVTVGEDTLKVTVLGASYDLGVAKLSASYLQDKYAAKKLSTYDLGAVVPFGLSAVRLSYIHANAAGAGTDADDATQLAVGYTYTLSKRTAVYATMARINNKGVAKFTVNDTKVDLPAAATGKKSTGYEFGIRHSF